MGCISIVSSFVYMVYCNTAGKQKRIMFRKLSSFLSFLQFKQNNSFTLRRNVLHFYFPEVDIQVMEPQQASLMSKIDGTRLPSTPLPFWTCISTSDK